VSVTALPTARPPALPGPDERGVTDIAARVLEKLAVRAAFEVDGVDPAPASGLLGRRSGPRITAHLDGAHVDVDLDVAMRYPLPVGVVADQVREQIRQRIDALTGMHARRINITVVFLRTPPDEKATPRVV
jgi:uncharacterized alkaline shock family protein YloU